MKSRQLQHRTQINWTDRVGCDVQAHTTIRLCLLYRFI